ncbi:MAG: hypothetical protein U0M21_04725, partial [Emergencia sp.]|nr:hypothetical protein [Emergencia sp.]
YYYKVRAVSASGMNSEFSDIASVTCEMEKPVIEKASINDSGKPQVEWKKVDGASKYEVYRATSKDGTYTKTFTTAGTTYINTSAKAGDTYYYKVRAVSASGMNSEFSDIVSVTCELAKTMIVNTSTNDSGQPRLTWDKVAGAEKYVIYRSGYSNGEYTKMFTTTNTSYTNTSAGAGYTYFYKVQALDKDGKVIAESDVVKQKCEIVAQETITAKGGNSETGNPRLTWNTVNGAEKYVIYRSGYSNGTYSKMYTTTKTSYTNTSAGAGYTYFYKVEALDKDGKVIAKSNTVKQLCCLEKPDVDKGNSGSGKPMLTWEEVNGADKYVIYRSGYSNGTYTKMYTTTKTSYTNTSAKSGYTYYYKVVAVSEKNQNANATSEIIGQKCLTSGLEVTNGNASSGKPRLSWEKVDGATKYEIYRSGYSNGTYTKMYTTTKTSYTNTSAKAGYTYFYKVKAISEDGFLESEVISVKSK